MQQLKLLLNTGSDHEVNLNLSWSQCWCWPDPSFLRSDFSARLFQPFWCVSSLNFVCLPACLWPVSPLNHLSLYSGSIRNINNLATNWPIARSTVAYRCGGSYFTFRSWCQWDINQLRNPSLPAPTVPHSSDPITAQTIPVSATREPRLSPH